MSNRLMTLSWPLQMPPTPKAVLIALADQADDTGLCWPSIPTVCERTCFSRRAVIDAIGWLERAGVVKADRSDGRHTRYAVTPESFQPVQLLHRSPVQLPHPCSSRTGAAPAQTSAADAPPPCSSRTGPVQQPHPNHQEPSRTVEATPKRQRTPGSVIPCPEGVDSQTWADWLALRKAKSAPVTETVLREATREAAKAGLPLTRFLEVWCVRGSQGLQADWLKPNERGPPANAARPSAAADFRGKTYDATPDENLPLSLR